MADNETQGNANRPHGLPPASTENPTPTPDLPGDQVPGAEHDEGMAAPEPKSDTPGTGKV